MGNQLGIELKKSNRFNDIDIIVPVPLHRKKQKERGYNQSEEIAKGIVNHFDKEINTTSLIKTTYTKSQTKQNRFSRWKNVSEIFSVTNTDKIENKHILLVDDVITTGATLEACAKELLKIPSVKVSIATLAYAGD
ncbi:MAG: ComF family protein [Bacteroidales bacterium]|nr:ComF family protein [Bacteroidales bacterium]